MKCEKCKKEVANDTFNGLAYKRIGSPKNLIIPDGYTRIEDETEFGTQMESITLPATLEEIDFIASMSWENLKEIFVSENSPYYKVVDGVLFNKSLTTLVLYPQKRSGSSYSIPKGVKLIDANAFFACESLTSISIPDSVKRIGAGAFAFCSGIRTITIPTDVKHIGFGAFSGSGLYFITIPESVTHLGSGAFAECIYLVVVNLPSSLKKIRRETFRGCRFLQTLHIPASIEYIKSSAFDGCKDLEEFFVSPDNKNFASQDGLLLTKSKKHIIVCPDKKRNRYITLPMIKKGMESITQNE